MKLIEQQLWLGSQATYAAVVEAGARVAADPAFKAEDMYDEEILRKIYDVQEGVARVSISGSLVNGSAGYRIFYGVTGYDDIRNALIKGVSDPNVSAILLDVSSGGGHVAGCQETSSLISRIAKIKPVVTYTGSMMASAAIWLGRAATHTVCAETSIVGSIGILLVHMEQSKMMEEMGVKVTVIRAGDEKALASPYEPLSDKAKANLEAQATALYGIFIRDMAKNTDMSVAEADAAFGQGREFLGKAAVTAGLIDEVGTYETAFVKAQKLGSAKKPAGLRSSGTSSRANSGNVQAQADASSPTSEDNQATPEGTHMPKALTQEQLDAMAAGVDLNADDSAPEADASTNEVPDGDDSSANAEVVSLKAQLDTLNSEHTSLKAQLQASTSETSALAEIARASVRTMGVHFGVKSDAVAAMDNATLLAEHARLSGLFKDKFKVGGVAATTQEAAPAKAVVPPMFAAVMKSTNAK